jgi:hypothetical protein
MTGTVSAIARSECEDLVLNVHYARRWPSVSYAFGLFDGGTLKGAITYGCPFSSTLRRGICGPDYESQVLELNRLCLYENAENEASKLIGQSLRLLPKGTIVVSFADTSQGHSGTVYQATNFIYSGLSAKRSDWKVRGMEHLHGQTISDMARGQENRAAYMRERFGDDFYLQPRPRKHRYLYFVGSKSFKKSAKAALRYPVLEYPKGQ